jgi:hypothetical protein
MTKQGHSNAIVAMRPPPVGYRESLAPTLDLQESNLLPLISIMSLLDSMQSVRQRVMIADDYRCRTPSRQAIDSNVPPAIAGPLNPDR